MTHHKKEYELVKIPKPEGSSNYLILDILSKESNQTKGVHIIDLNGKESFKIVFSHFIFYVFNLLIREEAMKMI